MDTIRCGVEAGRLHACNRNKKSSALENVFVIIKKS
jgi:hypothetical protein